MGVDKQHASGPARDEIRQMVLKSLLPFAFFSVLRDQANVLLDDFT
jgi:hypothetical protein